MYELENEIMRLRNDLSESNSIRKQQILELGMLRDEELARLKEEKEQEIESILAKCEQQRAKMREELLQENEKTSSDLKRVISEKQDLLSQLSAEFNERLAKLDEEKATLKSIYQEKFKSLEEQIDSFRSDQRFDDNRIQQIKMEHTSIMNAMKLKYEESLRGLMPREALRDYEETIESLKKQISTLQQKTCLLENEIEEKKTFVDSSTYSSFY